jgi:hypothetical protein
LNKSKQYFLFQVIFFCLLVSTEIVAQKILDSTGRQINIDSVPVGKKSDSVLLNHSPRKAAIRSAIIPGWGQAYNKRYWKIPIVYAALGTTAGVFVYNIKTYRDLRFAYQAKYKASLPAGQRDSTDYFKIKPEFINLDAEFLRYNRNEFRRNVDYTVLIFILLWGLNVVDATVDAHLKTFDVSPDLSFRFKPGYSDIAKTNGLSLVLLFK